MGRTEPSVGRPPAAFRKDVRSKKAKATINKAIPTLLSGNQRAQQGINAAELIFFQNAHVSGTQSVESNKDVDQSAKKGKSGRRSSDPKSDDQSIPPATNLKEPRISVRKVDTLTAARDLLEIETPSGTKVDLKNDRARVVILNMGSPLSPVVDSSTVQTVKKSHFACALHYTLPSKMNDLASIYTPNVLVFRDEEGEDLDKKDRFYVDCITAAMIRTPEYELDNNGVATYANKKDRELAQSKMRGVMRVAVTKKTKRLVLGAWGCGAHGNPVGEIARLWKAVLLPRQDKSKSTKERWGQLDEVVFAIKDHNMAQAFAEAFGEGLERSEDGEEEDGEEEEIDLADVRRQELLGKIAELEKRIETVVNPKVKEGLQSILEGLGKQLPADEGDSTQDSDKDDV
ncbi:hypothetical protein FCULG_00005369 [Fusarium culmorum]|uniref:Microbial-type PARG catalytic domain-containing protein n=1 Tax=Fusarium culmorum TaxID=5516 RepID=A0A2T4GST0_FUSCU|nr:hypothetical protein FCULG_00005369 [Fusarium culmorum]